MNYEIANEFPDDIIFEESYPCVSLYQPTHRYSPENKKDPILYKDLVREIEKMLEERCRKKDLKSLMKPFYQLKEDKDFWNNTLNGLAILANPGKCVVYKLNKAVQGLYFVSDSFYIKPLIRFYQSGDRFHLLGLSQSDFALYEGNRYGIEKTEIDPGTPTTIEEILGEKHTDSYLTHGTYGKANGASMYHGHGGKKDSMENDIRRFFRHVDRFVLDNYSKILKLPLILVSLAEHHGMFKKISRNPYLVSQGLMDSYKSFKKWKMAGKAWQAMKPYYLKRIKDLSDSFRDAKANLLGSDDLEEVSKATVGGRVGTIMLEADKMIPGKIYYATGKIEFENIKNPDLDDILDNLAKLVIRKKGEVVILSKEKMPSETGIAAIYRY
jgi:hypothetical protein